MIWGAMPIALVADRKIRLSAKIVYTALTSFQGQSESCYPTVTQILERIGQAGEKISRRSVWYALKRLEELHWISVVHRKGGRNTYRCHLQPVQNYELKPQARAHVRVQKAGGINANMCNPPLKNKTTDKTTSTITRPVQKDRTQKWYFDFQPLRPPTLEDVERRRLEFEAEYARMTPAEREAVPF